MKNTPAAPPWRAGAPQTLKTGSVSTLGPTFGENFLTKMHGPTEETGLGAGPQVTFYAQPTAPSTPIDLGKLSTWLDPNLRRYEPATALQFIPHYRRGIADEMIDLSPQARSICDVVYKSWGDSMCPGGGSEERANDRATVTVVTAEVRVRNGSCFKVIGIFPREIK